MSIIGYDSATNMLEIRNPWGTEANQTYSTVFEVDLQTLLADGDSITVDNVGNSASRFAQAIAGFSPHDATVAATPVSADALPAASPVLASPVH
jgi:hypothetical protein